MRISCVALFVYLCFILPLQMFGRDEYSFSRLDNTNGLSHNQVNAIYKDAKGFMWFGTMAGLNRFDGYRFKQFRHDDQIKTTISDEFVVAIYPAPDGKMLVETGSGFNIYTPDSESFNRNADSYFRSYGLPATVTCVSKSSVGDFLFVSNNQVFRLKKNSHRAFAVPGSVNATWACFERGGYYWLSYPDGKIERRNVADKVIFSIKTSATGRLRLFADRDNDVWVYGTDNPQGVFFIDLPMAKVHHFYSTSGECPLNNDIINGIVQDVKGKIWMATDHGGVNIIDKKSLKINYLLNQETNSKSIAQNSIVTLYQDNAGFIWVGTYKRGISYYNENALKFPLYQHQQFNFASLPYEDVNRFAEDKEGNIWVGTNGGGLICFNRADNSFKQFRHRPADDSSLSSDVIVSLWIDKNNLLWIGTYFGGLDCFDGKRFRHYRHNSYDKKSIGDDKVWELLEDSHGNFWVGTLSSGLDLLDKKTGEFRHFVPNAANSVQSTYISAFAEDQKGNLWIGTANGIDIRNAETGKFNHIQHSEDNTHSLCNNFIFSIYRDSRGLMWIGTRNGLSYFEPSTGYFNTLRTKDGLPDNTVLNVLEDAGGHIWVSTPNGLSRIGVKYDKGFQFTFKNYNEADGLQGRSFNENASLKTSRNELIFGGPNGFNIFVPEKLHTDRQPHQLVFTDFYLFNQNVSISESVNGDIVLNQSISEVKELVLKHYQNVFSVEFAALGASNPVKVKYAYQLDGFDKRWQITDGSIRKATYTNLDPGTYLLKVKASNDDGSWNDKTLSLKIVIEPPIWRTALAYIFYVFAFAGSLFLLRRRGIEKLKRQFALEQERQEAKRMHELDVLKIKFFTNVSHEFRTPLSLILTPIERMIAQTQDEDKRHQLQLVNRNAKRLLNLVNQLLDFRKMEVKELKLHPRKGNIIDFIQDSFFSFTDIADKKHIRFTFNSNLEVFETDFDHEKLERILFNLLSNAFKFTPNGGAIGLDVIGREQQDFNLLEIRISDTGIGIPADKKEKIFERFFQNETPGSIVNQGSGIGLAITKEFVNLHGGTIEVESEENKGSTFILKFGLKRAGEAEIKKTTIQQTAENKPLQRQKKHEFNFRKKTILLVEDNDDFRFYLKDNLSQYFNIAEAVNGKDGWQKVLASHPDLVVSDISMPESSGIELCSKIKSDNRTQHIPVILLTALAEEEQQIMGLETGASDYMTKPFNFEILLSKIRNQVQQHDSMKKTYTKQVEANPVKVAVESADEKFIQQALKALEKNIANSDYSVEEFSSDMNLSRVAFYKKILALTGKTPTEFVRTFRLKRAAQLLEETQLSVAEIAYQVGFNNPKYFARYFREEFGKVPSAYATEKKNKSAESL